MLQKRGKSLLFFFFFLGLTPTFKNKHPLWISFPPFHFLSLSTPSLEKFKWHKLKLVNISCYNFFTFSTILGKTFSWSPLFVLFFLLVMGLLRCKLGLSSYWPLLYSSYYLLLSSSLISWLSKKQSVVVYSRVKYRALTDATFELLWLCWLFGTLLMLSILLIIMSSTIAYIKHIKIECHFIHHHL